MTAEQFCFFLQGAIEIGELKSIDEDRVEILYQMLRNINNKKIIQKEFNFDISNNIC